MYTADDRETAKIGDRIIAAVIAGFCGYFFGLIVAAAAAALFGDRFGVHWIVAGAFALFAFIAPSRSRELWSGFWTEVLSWLSTQK